jgi:zinc transport system permease protein
MSFLFGSILAVPSSDLLQMAWMTALILGVVVFYYNDFLAMSYDDEFARLRGVSVTFLYGLLLGMITVSVVMTIRVVGLILVIALLTIPPFIAEKFTHSLRAMMILATLLSAVFSVVGLWVSFYLNWTSGATIILVAAAGFLVAVLWEGVKTITSARFLPEK